MRGLGDPQAAAIEQRQNRRVAGGLPRVQIAIEARLVQQIERLSLGHRSRGARLDARATNQRHGGVGHPQTAVEISVEGANRRQGLGHRARRERPLALTQLRQERAQLSRLHAAEIAQGEVAAAVAGQEEEVAP